MEKKIFSNKKLGVTLVEMIAGLAIITIITLGAVGFISSSSSREDKSNTLLDNSSYLKSALLLFDSNQDIVSKYASDVTLYFDTIEEMQLEIKEGKEVTINTSPKYSLNLNTEDVGKGTADEGRISKITAILKNNIKKDKLKKEIYIVNEIENSTP